MLGVCVLHAQSTAKVISGRNNTESCIITIEGSESLLTVMAHAAFCVFERI